jgi:hypothetical protein
MQVRRFTADLKTKIPGGHPGLYGVPIQLDRAQLDTQNMEELTQRFNGLPILLNRPLLVVAMYLEPHGSMDEHAAAEPILFLIMHGKGCVRIGGPTSEHSVSLLVMPFYGRPDSITRCGRRMSRSRPF